MKEEYYPNPVSPYGASKLACESLCYLYWKNYGVPIVSLRYFTVYGERQRPDMAFHKFIKAILKGEQIEIYGNGEQTRDFTYVDDIVKGTLLAAESDVEGRVFNLGGGSTNTINNVLNLLGEIIGKEVKVNYSGPQKGDVKHTLADTSRSNKELGFNPETEFEDGLEKEVEWIKKLYGF